jgi:hypothetical protein
MQHRKPLGVALPLEANHRAELADREFQDAEW